MQLHRLLSQIAENKEFWRHAAAYANNFKLLITDERILLLVTANNLKVMVEEISTVTTVSEWRYPLNGWQYNAYCSVYCLESREDQQDLE